MYRVTIPVKPYVKRFLTMNYGSPANLSANNDLHSFFRHCLKKRSNRFDKSYSNITHNHYSERVEIFISEDDFYRYGWELTNTDVVAFGRKVEHMAKHFMHNTVAAYEIALCQKDAIIRFQDSFGFSEDVWSFEAIKKDYYRADVSYGRDILKTIRNEIFHKIDQKFMEKLSPERTILQA